MKTTLIFRISLALLSALLVLSSFGQKGFGNEFAYRFYPKKSGKFSPSVLHANTMSVENISKKVLEHFNRQFHNAANVKWEQLNDNFLATFVRGETTTRSLFTKKGMTIYTIIFSSERELPSDVKNLIIKNYKNYTITSVARVEEDDRKIWVVKLAGANDYATARVEDGEMEETENFQKAN